jgi:hypothetical protein
MRHLPCRYNQLVVKRTAVFVFLFSLLLCPLLRAQDTPASGGTVAGQIVAGQIVAGQTMVVIPFENDSPTPGLEWLGESFPETFH